MSDDVNTFHASVTAITTVMVTMFGFIGKRFINKVDQTADALERHEKEDIGKYATVDQLTRVHERIDDSVELAERNFRELRDNVGEIKNILINGKRK